MSPKENKTPLWENLVGLLGLVLLCVGFVFLTWTKITAKESPPEISFSINTVTQGDSSFLVNVTVKNHGFQSVIALQVEAVLNGDDKNEERSNLEIDYLPSNSTRDIGFFFGEDPRVGELTFKALGYQVP